MKKTYYILLLLFILIESCNKTPLSCEFSGHKKVQEINLPAFDKVEVNPQISLTLIDTTFNKIIIEADQDVMPNISYKIEAGKLILKNNTKCLIQNTAAEVHVVLFAKNIKQFIANTDLDINSGNLLQFQNLWLICENASIGNNNIADFDLDVNIDTLRISANGSSIFKIKGQSRYLFVGFYGVNPIFRGKDLYAEHIEVFQRSDADMHLYPEQSITGDLYGYGDIYLYHKPPVINITEHYAGHIYFVN